MQTIKKSKIFLSILFLAALFFVDCSFEDKLGSEVQDSQISGGKKTNLPIWDKGYHRNEISDGSSVGGESSEDIEGSYIPKTYYGKYTEVGSRMPGYITVNNDNNDDYIMFDGGNKEYVKNLVYAGGNTWKQVVYTSGYYSTTWQYTLKTENNRRIFLFTYFKTHIDRGHLSTSNQYRYIYN